MTVSADDLSFPQPVATITRLAAEVPYRVRFDEAGPDGRLRTSVLLRYAQDVAWIHSESLGFDRRWYADRGLAWLVRSAELEQRSEIGVGETLLVRTQVVGARKVWARRRTEIRRWRSEDGAADKGASEPVAWLHTDWVMTDARGAPTRVPAEIPAVFGIPPEPFTPVRVELPEPPAAAVRAAFRVRPHELDPMAHANNAVYLDWAEEIAADVIPPRQAASVPRTARLEYVLPAQPGEMLEAAAWMPAGGREPIVSCAVRIGRADGGEVLRAIVTR